MEIYKNLSNTIQSNLRFLSDWNFKFVSQSIDNSEAYGDRLLLEYGCDDTEILVSIYYSEKKNGIPQNFSVFIDSKNHEGFFLNSYLMDNNLNDYRKKLKNIHDISRELFVKQFSASLNEIFKSYLSELLNGKSWNVEPFDWEPYK